MQYKKILGFLAILAVSGLVSRPARAETFNMNNVVSDDLFIDANSMSASKIQEFLSSQTGILKDYSVTVNGVQKSAAQVIYEAAQTYRISPKVILTSIQKESSMITRSTFSSSTNRQYYLDWIMFYGVCDSCSPSDPNLALYKGFYNQIDLATKAFRRYLDQIAAQGYTSTSARWGTNRTTTIQCIDSDYNSGRQLCTPGTMITIVPANAATAALYTYTPHPGGNYSFWTIWNRYGFNLRRFYPDGSLLRAQRGRGIFLIEDGKKRQFASDAAFLSRYSYSKIVEVPDDHLTVYETGRNIYFANYSLVKPTVGAGVYLLVNDTKRPITSRQAFNQAGFLWAEVVKVSWNDLSQFSDGEPITVDNIYPSGILFQNKKTGGIYFVQDGVRHPIPSKEVMRSQFGKRKAVPVPPSNLDRYTLGAPVGFRDGELVTSKTGGTVYVISDGYKLPIPNADVFNAYYAGKWGSIIKTNDASLAAHPTGVALSTDPVVQTAGQ